LSITKSSREDDISSSDIKKMDNVVENKKLILANAKMGNVINTLVPDKI
jgi:hypothetical protein